MQPVQSTPKGLRIHIAVLGRVNAGKSSFLNLVTGQQTSITSNIAGTTTDVVEKTQELLPIGPVVWLDTAGLGDESLLGEKRIEKTKKALDKADVVLLICEGNHIGTEESEIIKEAQKRNLPLIKIFNKSDILPTSSDGIAVNSKDLSSRDKVLTILKNELLKVLPNDVINAPSLLGVIMIVPID